SIARKYSEGGYRHSEDLIFDLIQWNSRLSTETVYPVTEARSVIDQYLIQDAWLLNQRGISSGSSARPSRYFDYVPFEKPEVVYNYSTKVNKVEMGRYKIKGH